VNTHYLNPDQSIALCMFSSLIPLLSSFRHTHHTTLTHFTHTRTARIDDFESPGHHLIICRIDLLRKPTHSETCTRKTPHCRRAGQNTQHGRLHVLALDRGAKETFCPDYRSKASCRTTHDTEWIRTHSGTRRPRRAALESRRQRFTRIERGIGGCTGAQRQ
jgi:hypothetical protein